ncbi:MAG: transglycosylase domain-containing protein, partial [Hyphomonadaceae bacterium]
MDALAKLRRTVRRPSLGWPRLWWPPEWWRRIALVVVYVLAPLVLLDLAFPPPMDRVQHVSAVVTDERGAVLRAYPVDDGKWRMRAHLDEIDPAFVRALLAYEDKRFRQHGGVDPLAIVRAASSAVSAGRIVSGGSTITMQTAR